VHGGYASDEDFYEVKLVEYKKWAKKQIRKFDKRIGKFIEGRRMSAPLNNTNAVKDDGKKDSFLHIRVSKEQKKTYLLAANKKKLSVWITEILDAAR
jgi:hypothetical protein